MRYGYVSGKWLIFAPADKVDMIWSSIATSLVSGPLNSTSAFLAKVATSSESEVPNAHHLICVYLPDVYDKTSVTEIMKILLRNHGVNLSGVKSDLYTSLGIDSKHASGIPSTVWKNAAILPDKDSKELKDAYFAELASNKGPSTETAALPSTAAAENSEFTAAPVKTKPKPKLKKKVEDDPFASDGDGEEAPKMLAKPKSEAREPNPRKESDDDDSDDGRKKSKAKASTKRTKKVEDDNDEAEDERPKKKVARK